MIQRSLSLALVLGCLTMAGCGRPSMRVMDENQQPVTDLADPNAPIPLMELVKPARTIIGPGDELDIHALDFTELSGRYLVTPSGEINLPMIGTLDVSGKDLTALDNEITSGYDQYFRNLDISVNVNEFAPRYVYVLGQVSKPGRYELEIGNRVLHALALAGGMNDKARENNVILIRRMSDGTDRAFLLEFHNMHKTLAPQDFYVNPGDIIFVPKGRYQTFSDFAGDFLDILTRASTMTLILDDIFSLQNRVLSIR